MYTYTHTHTFVQKVGQCVSRVYEFMTWHSVIQDCCAVWQLMTGGNGNDLGMIAGIMDPLSDGDHGHRVLQV